MTTITEPQDHPAYNDAIARANARARSDPGERYVVYWDGSVIYLRIGAAVPPPAAYSVYAVVYANGKYHAHTFRCASLPKFQYQVGDVMHLTSEQANAT